MNYFKEIIILFIIIVFVVSLEIITVNISNSTLSSISNKISELEKALESDNKYEKVDALSNDWKNSLKKLEYYMEHKELEEISSKVCILKSKIDNENVDEAKEDIDEIKFRIEHIRNKQRLKLENIF